MISTTQSICMDYYRRGKSLDFFFTLPHTHLLSLLRILLLRPFRLTTLTKNTSKIKIRYFKITQLNFYKKYIIFCHSASFQFVDCIKYAGLEKVISRHRDLGDYCALLPYLASSQFQSLQPPLLSKRTMANQGVAPVASLIYFRRFKRTWYWDIELRLSFSLVSDWESMC